jgi:hypothetical protein
MLLIMARYDPITQSNWLDRREKLIQRLVLMVLWLSIINFISLFLEVSRSYQFEHSPYLHFIGMCLLFLSSILRIIQAQNEGQDPQMEASRAWRERKGMMGPYDYMSPGPDYSNALYNILFVVAVIVGAVMVLFALIHTT